VKDRSRFHVRDSLHVQMYVTQALRRPHYTLNVEKNVASGSPINNGIHLVIHDDVDGEFFQITCHFRCSALHIVYAPISFVMYTYTHITIYVDLQIQAHNITHSSLLFWLFPFFFVLPFFCYRSLGRAARQRPAFLRHTAKWILHG